MVQNYLEMLVLRVGLSPPQLSLGIPRSMLDLDLPGNDIAYPEAKMKELNEEYDQNTSI